MKRLLKRIYYVVSALVIVGLGSGIAYAMYDGSSRLPVRQYFNRNYTNAVWDWSNPENLSASDITGMSNFMYLHQLNAVYIDIGGDYLSVLNNHDKTAAASSAAELSLSLKRMVATLGKRHIAVYASAGDVSWSNQNLQYIPLSIMNYVESYNQAYPNDQLAGVEFDIESYNQPGFSTGSNTVKSLILNDWLDMVGALATNDSRYASKTHQPLELGFAIPYWFDDENGNIPPLTRSYMTGPTLYFLMDRLNQLPRSNVVVMDYRNVATGNDGVIYHGRTNIDYPEAKDTNVKVLIGQEVNNVQPAKISYYGQTMTELSSQVAIFENAFRSDTVFKGIAINDLSGLEQMNDSD